MNHGRAIKSMSRTDLKINIKELEKKIEASANHFVALFDGQQEKISVMVKLLYNIFPCKFTIVTCLKVREVRELTLRIVCMHSRVIKRAGF